MLRSLSALTILLCLGAFALSSSAATITGTVSDASSRLPLGEMVVEAWSPEGVSRASARTDATGLYVMTVPSGEYRLLAFDPAGSYATAFDGRAESFETTRRVTVGGGTHKADFTLTRGGKASGRVSDRQDRPLERLVVAAYNSSGTRRAHTKTADDGSWALLLPEGSYRFAVYDEADGGWATMFHRNVRSWSEATPVTINARGSVSIDLKTGRTAKLSGRVNGSGETAIARAAVYVYTAEGALVTSTQTDSLGTYRLAVAEGTYRLVAADPQGVWAVSYYPLERSFEGAPLVALAAGEVRTGVDFGLVRAASIGGRVRSAQAALAGVEVGAFNADGSLHVSARTGSDGAYTLKVAPGELRIAAWDPAIGWVTRFHPASPDFESSTPLRPVPGATLGAIDVELVRGGRVKGTLRDSITKSPVSGARVAAYDLAGTQAGNGRSGPDGLYAFAAVPGDVRLVAFDPLMRYAAAYPAPSRSFDGGAPVRVAVGQETAVEFEVIPGVIINGGISDFLGAPLDGIEVFALDDAGHRVGAATTVEGAFAMVLVPGRYHFVAIDPMRRFAPRHYPAASSFEAGSPVDIANGPNASIAMTLEIAASGRRRAARH